MKQILLTLIFVLCIGSMRATDTLTSYVNPFIGTTNYGATNPGAVCPNGLMSITPFNVMGSDLNKIDKDERWWSMPYVKENVFLTGFSHTNLSGVGCPDLGSLLTIATMGELDVDYHHYGTTYSEEEAHPGYYTTTLSKYDIRAEITATPRTSCERYTFQRAGKAHILLNLGEGLTNESGACVRRISNTEFEGTKLLGTFCYAPQAVFPIYFFLRVHRTPKASGFWKKQRPMQAEAAWDKDQGNYKIYTDYGRHLAGDDIGVWMDFDVEKDEQIELSIGVSFVSTENARLNLDTEQNGKDFNSLRNEAQEAWEENLGRIQVEGGTKDDKTVFYTALYHTLLHPNILQDVNGEYPIMGSDSIGHTNHNRYTVYSLWDTYRNLSQLLTLVYPEKQNDMISTMIDMYKESGWMPKWELYGRETYTMDGDPAAPYIADAFLKGIKGYDVEKAYEGLRKSATDTSKNNRLRPYLADLYHYGFIPLRKKSDLSVSEMLENAVNDYALSQMADKLGYKKDASFFYKRSLLYRKYYRKDKGALCPLLIDSTFYDPFDPKAGANFSEAPGFHEGSSWNYTFAAPHDIPGLIKLMGGKRRFINKLNNIFNSNLYDPANEPDIIYPFLFSKCKGEEWRTQYWVKKTLDKYFINAPHGIPGNDDTGTMSAWAVFAMMGFYPDCPGNPFYTLTAPTFKKITIKLNPKYYKAKQITILSDGDDRLQKVKKYTIKHDRLINGKPILLY